jgi:uncharacterized protein DUF4235
MAAGAKIGIKTMSIVIGIPVGIATKKLVERIWILARPDDPPRKPSENEVQWVDAIAWGALSAAGIVVADLVTRRGAEAAFRAITGSEPPAAKPHKSIKKLEKASEKSRATAD